MTLVTCGGSGGHGDKNRTQFLELTFFPVGDLLPLLTGPPSGTAAELNVRLNSRTWVLNGCALLQYFLVVYQSPMS